MDDSIVQGVIETVDIAINYRIQLSQLLDSLHEAKNQVVTSAGQARGKLRSHFDHLKLCINEALDDRLRILERQVSSVEQAAHKPLCECEDLLQERVSLASGVLKEGKELLEAEDNAHGSKTGEMTEFKKKSKDLDLNSLPEVPSIWETACIHVDLPRDEENIQKQLVDAIKDYGCVMARAPVQVVEISERPAALLVQWAEVDDPGLDLDGFRLQYCVGTVHGFGDHEEVEFTTAYEGPLTSHVVRHLQPGVHYSFRVAGRAAGAQSWSPWSIPVSATTALPHHEWRSGVDGYQLSNENTAIQSDGRPTCILYSRSRSYTCGHSVMMKIVRLGCLSNSEGLGLAVADSNADDPLQKGVLFVSFQGSVFVDGQEKTTKLPPVSENSVVIFDTEVLRHDKVRVTVEVCERIVTFDWTLDNKMAAIPSSSEIPGEGQQQLNLFFLAKFSSGWGVAVE